MEGEIGSIIASNIFALGIPLLYLFLLIKMERKLLRENQLIVFDSLLLYTLWRIII